MLKNKTAIVTGSTSGIGLGIARALAADGANIMINGFGDAAAIESVKKEIAALGWRMNRPSRPSVEATVGSKAPSVVGVDSLLDFHVEVSLDGEALTREEIERLLASTDGLTLLRRPAAMPLMDRWMPRLMRSSVLPARCRRMSSTCR